MPGGRKKKIWPCGVCTKNCENDAIWCKQCNTWYHQHCEKITKETFSKLGDLPVQYVCNYCCRDTNMQFDYEAALRRLKSRHAKLDHLLMLEEILCRLHNPSLMKVEQQLFEHTVLQRDNDALTHYKKCGTTDGRVPVLSSGDGNCLFNSFSIALYGHENESSKFRLLCALELKKNREKYIDSHKGDDAWVHINGNFQEGLCDVATGKYVSGWAIQAMANVVGRPVCSVYPPMNGLTDTAFQLLNTRFNPHKKGKFSEPIFILWTNSSKDHQKTWVPNHFVPLLRSYRTETVVNLANDDTDEKKDNEKKAQVHEEENLTQEGITDKVKV